MIEKQPCWRLDLGIIDYRNAWKLQENLVNLRKTGDLEQDAVLFLEHPPVFTVGRRGGTRNLTVSQSFLDQSGVQLIHVERGGDITFHGPGQLVVYPIVKLKQARLSVLDFVTNLEEVMIRVAADWNIPATRNPLNRGVWVDSAKLGSLGIAVRRGVTFHGLALNVDPSLEPFGWINPCGLQGVSVTSMAKASGRAVNMSEVMTAVGHHWECIFQTTFEITRVENLTHDR